MPFGKLLDKEAGNELDVGGPEEMVMVFLFQQVGIWVNSD